ncbi:MAG: alpha/beta hydrolase [archaeon]|nr:alpha/beta hydrolase [archaeon]
MRSIRVEYDNSQATLSSEFTISYHDEGSKSRASRSLLLLHGLNAHSGTWRNNIPTFAHIGWRAIAPTLPRIDAEPSDENIKEYSKIIHELVVEKLDIQEIDAIGNSMGGWVAMQLAVSFPDMVKHLILEDSAGVGSDLPQKISMPTLIIWGERDNIVPVKDAVALNSKIKNSKLITVKDIGHVFHWEDPDGFNRTVERFLSE